MVEVVVRNVKKEELDEVMRVEKETWPEEIQASREKFESRMKIFPEGFFGVYEDGKLVGVSTSEIVKYDPKKNNFTWEEITDNGWIKNTHDPSGNALYVVSVGVSQKRMGRGYGSLLVQKQKELVVKLDLDCLVLGARLSGYHKYKDLSPEEYLKKRKEGTSLPFDPEIRFYERNGLKVVKLMANYMENDPESLNYGVVMVWENPNKKRS